jgi:dipeptidyl aminopeptidase/acylaminoacyl peptidase
LYAFDDSLVAASFDDRRFKLNGNPIVLFRNVPAPTLTSDDVFSVAGTLLSFRGGSKFERLVWFARDGQRIGAIESSTPLYNPMVSPDGTQLVATGSPARNSGLWMVDLKGNISTRLAPEGIGALWSPDGKRVAFTTRGGLSIKISVTSGRADETQLLHDNERKTLQDWSPDGRYLVFTRMSADTKIDLWLLPVSDPPHAAPLLHTAANERGARISPDGRWIAYTSDETGRSEVYVQEFPGLGSKRAVSAGGGAGPSWRQDGRELFYLSPTRTLMAVDVRVAATISFGAARPLFRAAVSGESSEARNHYAAAADGQKFLINVVEESADRGAITVVVNWAAGLSPAAGAASRQVRPVLVASSPVN